MFTKQGTLRYKRKTGIKKKNNKQVLDYTSLSYLLVTKRTIITKKSICKRDNYPLRSRRNDSNCRAFITNTNIRRKRANTVNRSYPDPNKLIFTRTV